LPSQAPDRDLPDYALQQLFGHAGEWTGGILGAGLVEIVRRAYGFLIFNFDPDDEIFVFGFSRGAFSARTFVNFVRHVGPLSRLYAAHIDEAVVLYQQRLTGPDGASEHMREFRAKYSSTVCIDQEDDAWRCKNMKGYVAGSAPLLSIKYLGIWDTVCALYGEHAFHDTSLTGFVERARHAVAIDERRALYAVVPLGDLTELNSAKRSAPENPKAPYQEKWFSGTHGSVGGGGDVRGLSDGSLAWVLKGAKQAGLVLDRDAGSRIHGFDPEPLTSLENMRNPSWDLTNMKLIDRDGPDYGWQVSTAAIRRWHAAPELLPERKRYRPKTLDNAAADINAQPVPQYLPSDAPVLATHVVRSGDELRALAKQYYENPNLSNVIFEANRDILDDPDDLFEGYKLRIPNLPPVNSAKP
jgi:uncharacterized protein (DUF2235 family)